MKADLVLFNGAVLTLAGQNLSSSALAISDGRIVAVGHWNEVEPWIGPQTTLHDLEGKTVLPGFNDAHIHVWKVGQLRTNVLDLRGVDSLERLYQRVQERAATLEPEAIEQNRAGSVAVRTWLERGGFKGRNLAHKVGFGQRKSA